jgi:glycine betaine/proline transport system ATP-binding protein
MAAALEVMIEAILALLQEPPNTGWIYDLRRSEVEYLYPEAWHPILITAIFAALAWWLHRSWKMPVLIVIGLLFIINQGYWDETTESLTLVLSACVVCMGIGVPIGIAAAHRPRLYAAMRPVLDLMQTLPTFVYLIPAIVFFGIGMVPGLIATVIFVLPAPIRLTHLGISSTPQSLMEAADAFGATPEPEAVEGGAALCAAADHDGAEPDDHAVAFHGGDRGACGRRRSGRAGRARAEPGEHRARLRGGADHRGRRDPARPPAQGAVEMSVVVRFNEVCIMFGPPPPARCNLADEGGTREEIQAETTHVLGVHDCTLEVEEGEILVLMGLSGSGKSTLLRAVNGLNPVARGSVEVDAAAGTWSMSPMPTPRRCARCARAASRWCSRPSACCPGARCARTWASGWSCRGFRAERNAQRVDRQLSLVGLSDWAERKVGELSGGMQQRVGLARAFATDAPILLMDEPFSALDPLIRTKLQDELLDLQRDLKRTIIFVSHDLDEAFKIGNRIAIMEGGRIVQCGTPRDIFSAPASDYVAEFVANMNPLGVLTARDVMLAGCRKLQDAGAPQGPETPVRDLMEVLAGGARRVVVEEAGHVIGTVTTESIIARLVAGE